MFTALSAEDEVGEGRLEAASFFESRTAGAATRCDLIGDLGKLDLCSEVEERLRGWARPSGHLEAADGGDPPPPLPAITVPAPQKQRMGIKAILGKLTGRKKDDEQHVTVSPK